MEIKEGGQVLGTSHKNHHDRLPQTCLRVTKIKKFVPEILILNLVTSLICLEKFPGCPGNKTFTSREIVPPDCNATPLADKQNARRSGGWVGEKFKPINQSPLVQPLVLHTSSRACTERILLKSDFHWMSLV